MWSKGNEETADEILDEDFELKDELWGSHPFVGKSAMIKQVMRNRWCQKVVAEVMESAFVHDLPT